MLATMTYSAEFLIATVFGLASGYALWFHTEEEYLKEPAHVTTNPCCNFMEAEAAEEVNPRGESSTDTQGSERNSDSSPEALSVVPEATQRDHV